MAEGSLHLVEGFDEIGGESWSEVVRKVGDGMGTRLLLDRWKGEAPYRLLSPRIFVISNQNESLVGRCGIHT